jgi:hypothetical protein
MTKLGTYRADQCVSDREPLHLFARRNSYEALHGSEIHEQVLQLNINIYVIDIDFQFQLQS